MLLCISRSVSDTLCAVSTPVRDSIGFPGDVIRSVRPRRNFGNMEGLPDC